MIKKRHHRSTPQLKTIFSLSKMKIKMDTPFNPHDPFTFEESVHQNLINQMVAMSNLIPTPPPVTNAELKLHSRMGDKRLAEAESEIAIFQTFNSFLTEELRVTLMEAMLLCYKQADSIDKNSSKLTNKAWAHGEVAGMQLLIMLSLAEELTRVLAKSGNKDAIAAGNALDNLKRNRGGGGASKNTTDNPPPSK